MTRYVEIGWIARAHGVRGELKVHLHWPASDVLLRLSTVWLTRSEPEPRAYEVRRARRAGKAVLLELEGVDDRDAAEALREARIEVPRETLPAAGADEYYLCDLVGARVLGPGGPVGQVVEVRPYPSADVVVIETPQGSLVEQPLVEPWVERVDVAAACIELSSTDGLLE